MKALTSLVQEISNHRYFPASQADRDCGFCRYRSYCNRGTKAGTVAEQELEWDEAAAGFDLDLDQVAEIEL